MFVMFILFIKLKHFTMFILFIMFIIIIMFIMFIMFKTFVMVKMFILFILFHLVSSFFLPLAFSFILFHTFNPISSAFILCHPLSSSILSQSTALFQLQRGLFSSLQQYSNECITKLFKWPDLKCLIQYLLQVLVAIKMSPSEGSLGCQKL